MKTNAEINAAAARIDTLMRELHEAEEYIKKVGAPQAHFRDSSVGELRDVKVTTQVHHQAYSGATNYWTCNAFDAALAKVVADAFPDLARAALAHMANAYTDALIGQKEALMTQLADIERLEAQRRDTRDQPSVDTDRSRQAAA